MRSHARSLAHDHLALDGAGGFLLARLGIGVMDCAGRRFSMILLRGLAVPVELPVANGCSYGELRIGCSKMRLSMVGQTCGGALTRRAERKCTSARS